MSSLEQQVDHEEQFAILVGSILDRIQNGENLSLASAVAEHPQFESDLREIWGILVVADVAASEARCQSSDAGSGTEVASQIATNLPRINGDY